MFLRKGINSSFKIMLAVTKPEAMTQQLTVVHYPGAQPWSLADLGRSFSMAFTTCRNRRGSLLL